MNSEENVINKVKEIAKLLDLSIEEMKNNHKKLDDCYAIYYWNPNNDKLSIIVASNGEYLYATSSISFEKLLEEFKTGKRNGKLNGNNGNILKCPNCDSKLTYMMPDEKSFKLS